jgi:hypothetical protein
MSKHTPGPWHYLSGAVYAEPDGDIKIGGVAIAQRGRQSNPRLPDPIEPTEKDANMRLIAAAPELLAALEEITSRFCCPEEEFRAIAMAAIKKARGA